WVQVGEQLFVLDGETGKKLASEKVGTVRGAALDDGAAFLHLGNRLVQWRRRGSGLVRRWSTELKPDASAPCIFRGELYLTQGGQLFRLRPGSDKPAWSKGSNALGAPALYGNEIYSIETSGDKASLVARARLDGREVARVQLGAGAKDGLVAVNNDLACVRVGDRWVLVRRTVEDGKLALSRPWEVPFTEEPMLYPRSAMGFVDKERTFMLYRYHSPPKSKGVKNNKRPLVNADDRKDLLRGAAMPIALGEWFCPGLWCGNLNANRILWHLHERPERKLLEKGVSLRPVPVENDRLMVVSRDKKKILCLQPEVIGQ
ncbi:MAG: hypothetical protein AAGD14_07890, partial [Planctomycetota bacterium]